MNRSKAKPGYLEFRPPSYQVLGPEQESTLDKILATYPSDVQTTRTADERTVRFWLRTPQVRCRCRLSVFAKPDQPFLGNPPLADPTVDPISDMYEPFVVAQPGVASLWVSEVERGNGPGVKASPVRNIVGTGGTPLIIPTDVRLWGYTFELETNGTELYGVFVAPNNANPALTTSRWHAVARFESVVPVSDEEWNQFLGKNLLRTSPQEGIEVTP
jgi:hypothetical protein